MGYTKDKVSKSTYEDKRYKREEYNISGPAFV
jgi:hypothetical protein